MIADRNRLRPTMLTRCLQQVVCVTILLATCAHADTSSSSNSLSRLHQLEKSKRQITVLKKAVDKADEELVSRQRRTCSVGLDSHHCSLAELDSARSFGEWLGGGRSPGKRTKPTPEEHEKGLRELRNIAWKRSIIRSLRNALNDSERKLTNIRKRTCRVSLGGQCSTQEAAVAMDLWHYLNSPDSPGRRRRDVTNSLLFQKLRT